MAVLPAVSIDNFVFGTPEADTLNGTSGNDLIHAGAGDDTVNGRGGADVLFGDRGADQISGGAGNDTVVWTNGDGSDVIDGGAGTDTLVVQGNDNAERFTLDVENGNAVFARTSNPNFQLTLQRVETVDLQSQGGDDRLTVNDLSGSSVNQVHFRGGDGNDTLNAQNANVAVVAEGENGNDQLTGGSASDQLQGGNGNDSLRGNGGNDLLVGGNGNDVLNGGAGRDALYGGPGNDQLTGGSGRDAFVFENNGGNDTVRDFTHGSDTLVLRGFSGTGGQPLTFNDLSGHITEQNGDSVIDVGNTTITVSNVTNLTQSDFVFA